MEKSLMEERDLKAEWRKEKAKNERKIAAILAIVGLALLMFGLILSDEPTPRNPLKQDSVQSDAEIASGKGTHENWPNALMPVYMPEQLVNAGNPTITAANPNSKYYYLQYTYYMDGIEIYRTDLIDHGDVLQVDLANEIGLRSGQEVEIECVTAVIYDDDKKISPQTLAQTFKMYKI